MLAALYVQVDEILKESEDLVTTLAGLHDVLEVRDLLHGLFREVEEYFTDLSPRSLREYLSSKVSENLILIAVINGSYRSLSFGLLPLEPDPSLLLGGRLARRVF